MTDLPCCVLSHHHSIYVTPRNDESLFTVDIADLKSLDLLQGSNSSYSAYSDSIEPDTAWLGI